MEFIRRAPGNPASLGILSGTFNPPTRAHLMLAEAGLSVVDQVLFVLPRVLPHKNYGGVGFTDRLRMLEAATRDLSRSSLAVTSLGLFEDIASECRAAFGEAVELKFLCGRDAAERVVNWDYGKPGAFLEMLGGFELLVARRSGRFQAPPEMRARIHSLPVPSQYEEVSATQVRHRIARGQSWRHLVPEPIAGLVEELYRI
jgi:nicotinate-nucleotide adenylyltransferase